MFGLSPKKLLILLLLLVVAFVGIQYGRAFLVRYEFDDSVRQSVKYAASTRKDPETVRREVLGKAQELGVDIGRNDVHITKRGPAFNLSIEYDWPVDLKVYQHVLTFEISEDGETFGQ